MNTIMPNIGDFLKFETCGLVKVKDRGVFERKDGRGGFSYSYYSIMEDLQGNVIKNPDGEIARFYDDFLTEFNFKVK